MRILLVEDDTALQTSLSGILRDAGYAVDATGDGIEGLFFGEEYPIDLAIIDLGLPGMSGLELIPTGTQFPNPDPDGTLGVAGQGRGVGVGCRRLPDQAIPPRRTQGARRRPVAAFCRTGATTGGTGTVDDRPDQSAGFSW